MPPGLWHLRSGSRDDCQDVLPAVTRGLKSLSFVRVSLRRNISPRLLVAIILILGTESHAQIPPKFRIFSWKVVCEEFSIFFEEYRSDQVSVAAKINEITASNSPDEFRDRLLSDNSLDRISLLESRLMAQMLLEWSEYIIREGHRMAKPWRKSKPKSKNKFLVFIENRTKIEEDYYADISTLLREEIDRYEELLRLYEESLRLFNPNALLSDSPLSKVEIESRKAMLMARDVKSQTRDFLRSSYYHKEQDHGERERSEDYHRERIRECIKIIVQSKTLLETHRSAAKEIRTGILIGKYGGENVTQILSDEADILDKLYFQFSDMVKTIIEGEELSLSYPLRP